MFSESDCAVLDAPCGEDSDFAVEMTDPNFGHVTITRPLAVTEPPSGSSTAAITSAASSRICDAVMFSADLKRTIDRKRQKAEQASQKSTPQKTPQEIAEAVVRFAFD